MPSRGMISYVFVLSSPFPQLHIVWLSGQDWNPVSLTRGAGGQQQLFFCDPETKFSQSLGWNAGERTARYAMIIDHGKVVYAEKEPGKDVTVCSKRVNRCSVGKLLIFGHRFLAQRLC
jgi:hypothetical protein